MAFTYPVKWITSTMRGAPTLSGTSGTFIGILDAFLLNGWGAANAISVTVSGGVGTATFAEGIYFEDHSIAFIAGATTPAALNGEARVLSHTNNSITFETDAPDGTATTGGTITFKYAPVGGWEKKYSGTNLAAYKSTDVTAHGHLWRVDDTGTIKARMVGYEAMTDVNTGSGPFPTEAFMSGGGYVHKSTVANASAARYSMSADSRAVLLGLEFATAQTAAYRVANIRGFGDAIALAPGGDAWSSFVSLMGSEKYYLDLGPLSGGQASSIYGFCAMPRSRTGLGGSVLADVAPYSGSQNIRSGVDTCMGTAPSVIDGQIKLSRLYLKEATANAPPRATIPGVLYVPQSNLLSLVQGGDIAIGSAEFSGRRLLTVVGGNSLDAGAGAAFMDITGPWR